jgi:hypothetical protein
MNIYDRRQIYIFAGNEEVYEYIDSMPQKFLTAKFLDTKLILSIRIALTNGLKTGARVLTEKGFYENITNNGIKHSETGASLGLFTLIEADAGKKYFFSVNSPFFKGTTGYILLQSGDRTLLCFDTISESPTAKEIIWWYLVKPFHIILANLVLKNIKNGIELKSEKNGKHNKMYK